MISWPYSDIRTTATTKLFNTIFLEFDYNRIPAETEIYAISTEKISI